MTQWMRQPHNDKTHAYAEDQASGVEISFCGLKALLSCPHCNQMVGLAPYPKFRDDVCKECERIAEQKDFDRDLDEAVAETPGPKVEIAEDIVPATADKLKVPE